MQHMASGGSRSLDKGGGGGGGGGGGRRGGGGGGGGGHPDSEIRGGRGVASKKPLYGSKWSSCRVGSGFLISVYDNKTSPSSIYTIFVPAEFFHQPSPVYSRGDPGDGGISSAVYSLRDHVT